MAGHGRRSRSRRHESAFRGTDCISKLQPVRILLQHPHAPMEISGVVTYCEQLRVALEAEGAQVQVLSTHGASTAALWRAVCEADVVHLNSHHVRLAVMARLAGKRLILKYHFPYWDSVMQDPFVPRGLVGRFQEEARFLVRLTQGAGLASWRIRHIAQRLLRAALRVGLALLAHRRLACSGFIARSSELPWPVEVDYYPVELPAEYAGNSPAAQPQFAFAGRLEGRKGCDVMVRALALLHRKGRRVQAVVIGDGPEREKLEELARAEGLGESVRFAGRLSRAQVRDTFAKAFATVVPSRDNDAFPYTVIEATAVGCCVIGGRAGGIPEALGPQGLLFDAEDVVGLAACMEYLLEHPRAAEDHARATFLRIQQMCEPRIVARRTLAFYA